MPTQENSFQVIDRPGMFQAPWKTEKVSDHIIEQIRDAILSGNFKPGDRVASEKELVDGFGVSKASVREALRVLEVMGLVEIRKGPSGGVFVAEVDMKTTINSIMNFLKFASVSIRDITMLRYLIEPAVARIAASKITPKDISNLETLIDRHIEGASEAFSTEIGFHRYLARMTEIPMLILVMDFVDNILKNLKAELGLGEDFYEKVRALHREILAPLAQGDGEAAARCITKDLLWVGDFMAEVTHSEKFIPAFVGGNPPDDQAPAPLGLPAAPQISGLTGAGLDQLTQSGLVFQEVGTGRLFLFCSSDNQGEKKTVAPVKASLVSKPEDQSQDD